MDINDWSGTAAQNNAAPPHGFPEGMNYSQVNDAARELMAAGKRTYADLCGNLAATGTANNYAVTLNTGYSAYFQGLTFRCTLPAANTGAAQINVNGIGARQIRDRGGAQLAGGMLQAGIPYTFYHVASFFTVLDPYIALPATVARTDALADFMEGLRIAGEDAGFRDTPLNVRNNNYTLALSDRGRTIIKTGSGTVTYTVPSMQAVAFPAGSMIDFVNDSASDLTIARGGTSVSIALAGQFSGNAAPFVVAPGGWIVLKNIGSGRWLASGSGIAA